MKKLRSLFLVMLCVVLAVPCMNVSAATQKQKALKAYKKFLSTSKVNVLRRGDTYYDSRNDSSVVYKGTKAGNVKFALAYINNDDIPDLVLTANMGGLQYYGFFTYRSGKVRRITVQACEYDKVIGYYKKTGVFVQRHYSDGVLGNWIYMSMGKTSAYIMGSKDGSYYVIRERMMTKKGFNNTIKKETRNRSLTKFKFFKNTKTNRNKKIK